MDYLNNPISIRTSQYYQNGLITNKYQGLTKDTDMYTSSESLSYNNEEAKSLISTWNKNWSREESQIQVEKEPITREWESGCPFGFEESKFTGRAYRFCPKNSSSYSYITTQGKTIPKGSGYAVAKSLKMPKGYSMKLSGAFISSYFSTQIESGIIRNMSNGENQVRCEKTGEVSNLFEFSYWVCGMNIIQTQYVKVTQNITKLLESLLILQHESHSINQDNEKVKECETVKKTKISEKETENNKHLEFIQKKEFAEKSIEEYREKIETYKKIINGKIEIQDWDNIIKRYEEEIKKLRHNNSLLLIQKNEITTEISTLELEENNSKNLSNKKTTEITTTVEKITTERIKITEQQTKIDIELTKLGKEQKLLEKMDEQSSNSKYDIKIKTDEIERLRLQIKELQDGEKERKKIKSEIVDRIEKIKIIINKFNQEIAEFKKIIQKHETKIITIKEKISENETTENSFRDKIRNLTKKLKILQISIDSNEMEINKFDGYKLDANTKITDSLKETLIKYYKLEIETLLGKIEEFNKKIEKYTKIITESMTKIQEYEKIITETTTCIESNRASVYTSSDTYTTVNKIIEEINQYYPDSINTLNIIRNYATSLETKILFLKSAKPKLHSFLDNLVADPQFLKSIEDMLRRRRLRTKRRRRLI